MVRISNTGTASLFATIPNLPVSVYNVADVDANGHLYLYSTDTGVTPRFFVVDVNPNSATYLHLVDPATGFQLQTSNFGVPLNPPQNISDWAFNPADVFLYSVNNTTSQVLKINPVTGVVTGLTTTGLPVLSGNDAFGSIYFDSAGNMYAMRNSNGRIFRNILTPTTATATAFSTTAPALNSDRARCSLAAGASKVVTFQVRIGNTVPNPNWIPNATVVSSTNAPTATNNTVTTLVFKPSRGVLFI